jgi:phage gpG-like protein
MVDFHGNARQAIALIRRVVAQLTGNAPDDGGMARGVFYAIGIAALSDVQEAFIVKSRGGVGEDGIQWPPLSKKYLAYGRRFGPGEQAALKRGAGLGRGHNRGVGGKGGLLTAAQQKHWRQVYARTLAWAMARYDEGKAKSIAAGHAWNVIKAAGAKTKLEVYGNRIVDILRDTGVLFNSLSPGYLEGSGYTKPTGEGGDQQVFSALRDGIVIGTTVRYAGAHNAGKGVPKRQIFPERIPAAWARRWAGVGVSAIENAIEQTLRGAA